MVATIISENGKQELNRLDLDIETVIAKILEYIPKMDLIGLDHIAIHDLPEQWKKHLAEARASYYEKQAVNSAYIELYLKRMFKHIKSVDSLKLMFPIQCVGIAQTVFHEVGHHVERTRSHGIKKREKEEYADSYAKKLLNKYILDNAESINNCFNHLEKIAIEKGLSLEKLRQMRSGWEKQYSATLKEAGSFDPTA